MNLLNNSRNKNEKMFEVIKVNITALIGIVVAQYTKIVENIVGISEAATSVVTFFIVLFIAFYNFFKLIQILRETKWDKEDRENDLQ